MTVKKLIEALQKFDPDTLVAVYNMTDETDFPIVDVTEVETEDGAADYFSLGDTDFTDNSKVVVIAGGCDVTLTQ